MARPRTTTELPIDWDWRLIRLPARPEHWGKALNDMLVNRLESVLERRPSERSVERWRGSGTAPYEKVRRIVSALETDSAPSEQRELIAKLLDFAGYLIGALGYAVSHPEWVKERDPHGVPGGRLELNRNGVYDAQALAYWQAWAEKAGAAFGVPVAPARSSEQRAQDWSRFITANHHQTGGQVTYGPAPLLPELPLPNRTLAQAQRARQRWVNHWVTGTVAEIDPDEIIRA